jgi:hypothetical protein
VHLLDDLVFVEGVSNMPVRKSSASISRLLVRMVALSARRAPG